MYLKSRTPILENYGTLKSFNFFNPFIKEITFFYGLGSITFCFLIFNNQWHSIFNKITFLKCMNQPVGYLGNISFKKRLYVVLVSILRYTVFMFQYYFLFNGLMMSFDFFDAINTAIYRDRRGFRCLFFLVFICLQVKTLLSQKLRK